MSYSACLVLTGTLIAATAGCGLRGVSTSEPRTAPDQTITEQQILATSAKSAWEVLKYLGRSIDVREDTNGRPVRIIHRGRGSIYLREEILVVVDGTESRDLRTLQLVPARDIARIRILSASRAATDYGSRAASGAILIDTKRGPHIPPVGA
jgi:outer membrane cobalamin receptor